MNRDEVLKKYEKEIYMAKLQIKERFVRLSKEEIEAIEYRQDPRNRAEQDVKDNYMSFISQRLLEGFSKDEAISMALIVVNDAIDQAKKEGLPKKRKFSFFKRTLRMK